MGKRVLIITGERGAGKTVACQRVVELARAVGYSCAGLLTLSEGREHLTVVDVASGERRTLTVTTEGVRQGPFLFDPEVLTWGAEVLEQALPCDLLVVDELGPLEFERRQGWSGALELLRRGQFGLALVVIRPSLVLEARAALASCALTVLTVEPNTREQIPYSVMGMLERVE
jgi:nucleoside-triphosphatase